MSTEITITLPDEIYQRAERFARLANRDVATILSELIQTDLLSITADVTTLEPISVLSDEQVLELTELQLEADQDARLSQLLALQQSGKSNDSDRAELEILMQLYREGLLRKATALSEAVKRGLIAPLSE